MEKLNEKVYEENNVKEFPGKDIDLALSHDFEWAEKFAKREIELRNENRPQ